MAENIEKAAASQPEWSSETCLPESELVVFCVTRGHTGCGFFLKLSAEDGTQNGAASALGKELNRRNVLFHVFLLTSSTIFKHTIQ